MNIYGFSRQSRMLSEDEIDSIQGGFSIGDIIDVDGWYWDASEPWCFKPSGVDEKYTFKDGYATDGDSGIMIDCRIDVSDREKMCRGLMNVMSYGEWKVWKAKLEDVL